MMADSLKQNLTEEGYTVDTAANSFKWNYYIYKNQPYIFAGTGTSNVAVIGQDSTESRIEMTTNGASRALDSGCPSGQADNEPRLRYCRTIQLYTVAFMGTDTGTIQTFHITGALAVGIAVVNSSNVTVRGTKFDNQPVDGVQAGGIEVQNSQHVVVDGNYISGNDDGIGIISVGRGDPQCGTGYWCEGYASVFTDDVEIKNNTVADGSAGGNLSWMPWGADDPNTGIRNINIHDNAFQDTNNSAYCWCDDPYDTTNGASLTPVDLRCVATSTHSRIDARITTTTTVMKKSASAASRRSLKIIRAALGSAEVASDCACDRNPSFGSGENTFCQPAVSVAAESHTSGKIVTHV